MSEVRNKQALIELITNPDGELFNPKTSAVVIAKPIGELRIFGTGYRFHESSGKLIKENINSHPREYPYTKANAYVLGNLVDTIEGVYYAVQFYKLEE